MRVFGLRKAFVPGVKVRRVSWSYEVSRLLELRFSGFVFNFRSPVSLFVRWRVTSGSSSSTPDLFFDVSSSVSGGVGRWRVNVTFTWCLVGSASRRRLPGGSEWALHKGVSRASDPVACRVFGSDYGACAS
ncbi:hypothetical protein Bca101_054890 [Brassica carinata]